jgi:poly-gamma-glutamate synthesis protein (capsule biosynthesis protein)
MSHAANRFRLAAVGDVMLARGVGQHFVEAPGDFAMNDVRELLQPYDVVCANLENPVAEGGSPDPVQDPNVTFRAHPGTLNVLKTLGVTVVSLGNNHMLDYGEGALAETLDRLDAAGIRWVGAGRNYEEANRPLVMNIRGRRVAFLSYAFIYSVNTRMATRRGAGVSDHRLSRILAQVRQLCRAGHDVIVMSHWGHEYSFYPLPYQMRAARRMIDAGARLVLGHGPHYPQGMERYRDGEIVYSLGNFIFDEPQKFANRSFVYGVDVDDTGTARRSEVFPVHLRQHVPVLVEGAERRRLTRLIETLSTAYRGKDRRFWRQISASYLTDLCARVIRGRSLKYLLVPELSFYRDVGPGVIVQKLAPSPGRVLALAQSLRRR